MRPDTITLKLKNIELKDWDMILDIVLKYQRKKYTTPIGKKHGVVYSDDTGDFLVYRTQTAIVVEKLSA